METCGCRWNFQSSSTVNQSSGCLVCRHKYGLFVSLLTTEQSLSSVCYAEMLTLELKQTFLIRGAQISKGNQNWYRRSSTGSVVLHQSTGRLVLGLQRLRFSNDLVSANPLPPVAHSIWLPSLVLPLETALLPTTSKSSSSPLRGSPASAPIDRTVPISLYKYT